MNDRVLQGFLQQQFAQGMALADKSDLLELFPMPNGGDPPDHYMVRFGCKGLVRTSGDEVVEAADFRLGIAFPADYLRRVEPAEVLTWFDPPHVWHPNIRPPWICVGHIGPGTELVDLLYQCYEIITYHNWAAHDALNPDAAQWCRNHQDRFPVDRRPLKRRTLSLQLKELSETP